jgi:Zn-dependent M28 family amino/carboxypeptidase
MKLKHLVSSLLILMFVFSVTITSQATPKVTDWDQEARLLMHIAYLASDLRDGRGIGTEGLDASAEYISNRFEEYGLSPLFENSYFQEFNMGWGASILPGCTLANASESLEIETDYIPSGFSGSGSINSSVVFVGYGISAPEYTYEDYTDVEVEGKIVFILEGEPNPGDDSSKFSGAYDSDHSTLRTKAINAKTHGAAGIIFVSNYPESTDLPQLYNNEPYRDVGIPAIFLKRNVVEKVFPNFNLENAQRSIDLNEAPRSMDIRESEMTLTVNIQRNEIGVKNVGGYIPGSDEIIIIGGHYDHLGFGQMGSTDSERGVHNGADDNASGIAELIELARIMATDPPGPTIWFVAFTGEEVGLVGSNYFVNNPPSPIENVKYMLNYDMIGRITDNKLSLLGVESATELMDLALEVSDQSPLELACSGGGYGASDQTSFYIKGIPVSHFLSTLHEDYHNRKDDISKINSLDMVDLLDLSLDLVYKIADPKIKLTYVEKSPPAKSGRGGRRVSMGTIPDFTQPDSIRGVRIQGVTSDSPAQKAGLQGMDVLVGIDDIILDNIYDFMFVLKKHIPGDEVVVRYTREGVEYSTKLILAPSKRPGGGGHGR